MQLQIYTHVDDKGKKYPYYVDYRLKQFRTVTPDGLIDFISFRSDYGDMLLCEMLEKHLIPADNLRDLL